MQQIMKHFSAEAIDETTVSLSRVCDLTRPAWIELQFILIAHWILQFSFGIEFYQKETFAVKHRLEANFHLNNNI